MDVFQPSDAPGRIFSYTPSISDNMLVDLCDSDDEDRKPAAVPNTAQKKPREENDEGVIEILDESQDNGVVFMDLISPSPQKRRRTAGSAVAGAEDDDEIQFVGQGQSNVASLGGDIQIVGERSPLQELLQIFPDIDIDHARKCLQEAGGHVEPVVEILASATSYPKSKATAAAAGGGLTVRDDKAVVLDDKPKYSVDFMDKKAHFVRKVAYFAQAQERLTREFRFLTKPGLVKIFRIHHMRYAMCHDFICNAIMGPMPKLKMGEDPDEANDARVELLRKVLKGRPLTDRQRAALAVNGASTTLKKTRANINLETLTLSDPVLTEEVGYVTAKLDAMFKETDVRIQRRKRRAEVIAEGLAEDCGCCFDEFPAEDMVGCRQRGHLFCTECVCNFAKTQVFGAGNLGINAVTKKPATELLCMHGDGCASGFSEKSLERVLPARTYQAYNQLQCQLAIQKATDGGSICSCPKCDYKAMLPDTQRVFACPVATCRFESCRDCGEESHIPLRCDEYQKDKTQTDGRLQIEEAITKAKIRQCPKCKKSFVKEMGCNKMTCACGTKICYICREVIQGYEHFRSQQNPNGCQLHTNFEEDDKRAMREAGIDAAARVRETVGPGVNVDVDGIMEAGVKPVRR